MAKEYPCALFATRRIVAAAVLERLPPGARLYAWPFGAAYALWAAAAARAYLSGAWDDLWYVPLAGLALANGLVLLACQWSAPFDARVTCRKLGATVRPVPGRHLVVVVPRALGGKAALVPVTEIGGAPCVVFQQQRFVWRDGRFEKVRYPVSPRISELISGDVQAGDAQLYDKNVFDIPKATFLELFREHAVAPFFVFQVVCVGLWCLEDYWYYSLFTLFMLVVFESTVVFQRLKNMAEFRAMSLPVFDVAVRRAGTWTRLPSDALLPGDVVALQMVAHAGSRDDAGMCVPCDVVLVEGSCVVNEAMISGESTPLLKEAVVAGGPDRLLDIKGGDRQAVLFGGTRVLQISAKAGSVNDSVSSLVKDDVANSQLADASGPRPSLVPPGALIEPEKAHAVAVVLRTGYGTLQGRLVRTMVHTAERMSANSAEALAFILFLLVFALAAAAYVLYHTWGEPGRSRFKLLVEAALIVTAVVPPELPMELTMAVNNSLIELGKHAIFCMEPFRIPVAGRIDVMCFDKTGTLTAENLEVRGVVLLNSGQQLGPSPGSKKATSKGGEKTVADSLPAADSDRLVTDADRLPRETLLVLGTCHALFRIDGKTVGDPMEREAAAFGGWSALGGDVFGRTETRETARVLARFPFSSALRRMAAVVQHVDAASGRKTLCVVAKGAPEVLESRFVFSDGPAGAREYAATHKKLALSGARVLAMGYKALPEKAASNLPEREDAETGLSFAGFLVFHCPLKEDSRAAVVALQDSLHRVVMLTGDNVLTAAHAAAALRISWRPLRALQWSAEGAGLRISDLSSSVDASYGDDAITGNGGDATAKSSSDSTRSAGQSDRAVVPLASLPAGLDDAYDYCLSGETAERLYAHSPALLGRVAAHVAVIARASPTHKEMVLLGLRAAGHTTLMCGDGTNDVGALKHAHVGVALLDGKPADLKRILDQMKQVAMRRAQLSAEKARAALEGLTRAGPAGGAADARRAEAAKRLEALTAQLEADEAPIARLGDASVAAPFTSKIGTAQAVCTIVRQGRCTLAATMQMYKILALNSLIAAFGLSVLHLEAVRYGDFQSTITGMLLASCFMFLAKARPVEKLAPARPQATIMNAYVLVSVLGQFALHLGCLLWVVSTSLRWSFRSSAAAAAKFAPSLLNTTVYLAGLLMQVSTFVVNYQGAPFRESLAENASLRTSLLVVSGIAVVAAAETYPELNAFMELVPMPAAVRRTLLAAMALDFGGCLAVEWLAKRLLFDAGVSLPLRRLRPQ